MGPGQTQLEGTRRVPVPATPPSRPTPAAQTPTNGGQPVQNQPAGFDRFSGAVQNGWQTAQNGLNTIGSGLRQYGEDARYIAQNGVGNVTAGDVFTGARDSVGNVINGARDSAGNFLRTNANRAINQIDNDPLSGINAIDLLASGQIAPSPLLKFQDGSVAISYNADLIEAMFVLSAKQGPRGIETFTNGMRAAVNYTRPGVLNLSRGIRPILEDGSIGGVASQTQVTGGRLASTFAFMGDFINDAATNLPEKIAAGLVPALENIAAKTFDPNGPETNPYYAKLGLTGADRENALTNNPDFVNSINIQLQIATKNKEALAKEKEGSGKVRTDLYAKMDALAKNA